MFNISMINLVSQPNGFDFSRAKFKCPEKIPLFWDHPDEDNKMNYISHSKIGFVENIQRVGPLLVGNATISNLKDEMKEVINKVTKNRLFINVSIECEVDMEEWPVVDSFKLDGVAIVEYGACSPYNGCFLENNLELVKMSEELDNLRAQQAEIARLKKKLELSQLKNHLCLDPEKFSADQIRMIDEQHEKTMSIVTNSQTNFCVFDEGWKLDPEYLKKINQERRKRGV